MSLQNVSTKDNYLGIVTVYKNTSVYTGGYLAIYSNTNLDTGEMNNTKEIFSSKDYAVLQEFLKEMGLVRVNRMQNDAPTILETWI